MEKDEEQWAIVIWEYGWHCDEFNLIEVKGPFSYKEAQKIEYNLLDGEFNAESVPMNRKKKKEPKPQ